MLTTPKLENISGVSKMATLRQNASVNMTVDYLIFVARPRKSAQQVHKLYLFLGVSQLQVSYID